MRIFKSLMDGYAAIAALRDEATSGCLTAESRRQLQCSYQGGNPRFANKRAELGHCFARLLRPEISTPAGLGLRKLLLQVGRPFQKSEAI